MKEIQYIQPFDCDVEEALDQITKDEQTRGKIRSMILQITESGIRTEYDLRQKIFFAQDQLKETQCGYDTKHAAFTLMKEAAEGFRLERDRLAEDALAAISQFMPTPERGYVVEPHCLRADIERLGRTNAVLFAISKKDPRAVSVAEAADMAVEFHAAAVKSILPLKAEVST